MKIGDKIPVVFQIIREVADGEVITQNGVERQVSNALSDKYWAAPVGHKGPELLCCFNGETADGQKSREALVHLIQSFQK